MERRYSRRAVAELDTIGAYLSERNPYAATTVLTEIEKTIVVLEAFPYAGRKQKLDDVRKIVSRNYRYIIYYRFLIDIKILEIISIQHPRQDQPFSNS